MTLQATIPFEVDVPDHVFEDEIVWRDLAACRGSDLQFIAERFTPEQEQAAKAVCAGCPVTFDCLAYSVVSSSPYGIFGGLNDEERKRWRRRPSNRESVAEWHRQQLLNIQAAAKLRRL